LTVAERASSVPLPSAETYLGAYVNIDKSIAFALTEQALYVSEAIRERYRRVPLKDIRNVARADDVEKRFACSLKLTLEDGSEISLRVDGRDDRFSDVFEVQRFFMRVQSDFEDFPSEGQES
jgi:hypothetical protein